MYFSIKPLSLHHTGEFKLFVFERTCRKQNLKCEHFQLKVAHVAALKSEQVRSSVGGEVGAKKKRLNHLP